MNEINKIIKKNNLIMPKEVTKKYDEDGNVIWEKSPNGDIWEYRYKEGHVIWEKSPNGDIWKYRYKDNKLVWQKSPNGEEYWREDDDVLKLENGNYYLNGEKLEKQNE